MKVAIIGAGYAGLALAWHFLQKTGVEVTVFAAGEGASHVSTGLLHPCPGKQALLTWRAEEGMAAARQLLDAASFERPVCLKTGILRFIADAEQWIPEGITVFSRVYLTELRKACRKASFVSHRIESLEELKEFDASVFATGAETLKFFDLPLKKTLGQSLLCRCKEPFSYSLLSDGHITPTEDPEFCLVGSTYEHTPEPSREKALALLERVSRFYPPAQNFEIVDIQVGVRISPKTGYRPLFQPVGAKTWVFTGLGSRGLIYHGMIAKELVQTIIN